MRLILILIASFLSLKMGSQNLSQENLNYLNMLPPEARAQVIGQLTAGDAGAGMLGMGMMATMPPVASSLFDKTENTYASTLLGSKRKFGYDFFTKTPSSYAPLIDLPIPNTYQINPGDILEVITVGADQLKRQLRVGLNGVLQMPVIGDVQIAGLTLEQVNMKVNEIYSKTSLGTEVIISMQDLQPFQVFVLGAAKNPGAYTVNPLTTASNLLILSGGVEDYGSLRNMQIKRGEETYPFDFYKQLIFGDRSGDKTLRPGDTVFIPPAINFVEVKGKVNRPLTYEIKKTDTISDILTFAQEALFDADMDRLVINYVDQDQITNKQISASDQFEDVTKILSMDIRGKGLETNLNPVVVGPVKQNDFIYSENIKLNELIKNLEFADNVYPFFGVVMNDVGNFKLSPFSLSDADTYRDIEVKPNSVIRFFANEDIQVFNDLLQESAEDLDKLENRLLKSFFEVVAVESVEESDLSTPQPQTSNALKREIEKRFNENFIEDSVQSRFESQIVGEDALEDYKNQRELEQRKMADASSKLLKYEFLLTNPEIFKLLKSHAITVEGEFTRNGLYPVFGSVEINKIIDFIGGYTPMAEKSMVEYIDLSNNISVLSPDKRYLVKNPINASLTVPSISSKYVRVKVMGEVNNPGEYTLLPGTTLEELYRRSGGLKSTASSKSIFLSRASVKRAEKEALENSKKKLLDGIFYNLTNANSAQTGGSVGELVSIFNLADQTEPIGRVVGDLSPESKTAKELILEQDDEIYVFNKPQIISVIGEVNSSSTLVFQDNKDLNFYIESTGGFTKYANKREVYVISSDGTARPVSGNYFSSDFYRLAPGDTIVVPKKLGGISGLPLVQVITRSVSDIAFAAASLNAISD